MKKILTIIGVALLSSCVNSTKDKDMKLNLFATMPNLEAGFEKGVSACYAAVYDNNLYITGGCNFPEKPVTEGGVKRYYKDIFMTTDNGQQTKVEMRQSLIENKQYVIDTSKNNNEWKKITEMPLSSAYGANIQYEDTWIIAGGMNENGATKNVIKINLSDNCSIERLPDLPCAIDNTTGTYADDKIYVVGGNADGKPSNKIFILDMKDVAGGWLELAAMPSRGRVQPVCAATPDALFVWGGFSPKDDTGEAVAYTDGLRYDFKTAAWTTLSDVMAEDEKMTFTGGTMTKIDDNTFLAAGGVNHKIFTDAISGRYELISKADYMHKEPEWYKFNQHLMMYDVKKNEWRPLDKNQVYARAGALLLTNEKEIFYIGGELKPGIRTPEIHQLTVNN